eukprot:CAMPEP_0206617214 /NCGR_PEP_ID=MMETSP0325_2-20121206/59467_1 /ASSEMBLY_ACC=CAM_ASM_000347 /TAXON_ID=2866 /ORGANISM="Crypthecodinium cohnii, Strain Seligo" /LENGTH=65 /DNA_ID=CAMNT_0054139085 /DNA_START=570 /DNA_END=764 /DNA_ORIENTATION=-
MKEQFANVRLREVSGSIYATRGLCRKCADSNKALSIGRPLTSLVKLLEEPFQSPCCSQNNGPAKG